MVFHPTFILLAAKTREQLFPGKAEQNYPQSNLVSDNTDVSSKSHQIPPQGAQTGLSAPPQQFQTPPMGGGTLPPNVPPPRPPGTHHLQHLSSAGQLPSDFNAHNGNSIVAPPQLNFNRPPPMGNMPPPSGIPPPNRPQIPPPDIWVETTAPNGKVYYYHAQSRQTQWNRPVNATVMTQEEFKKMVLTISSNLPLPNMGGPMATGKCPICWGCWKILG